MADRIEVTAENVDALVEKYADEWWPATDISELFPVNEAAVNLWSRRGLVRSVDIPKELRVHRGPRKRYSVADVIVARTKVKRSHPFRVTMVDGVRHGWCNKCGVCQPAEGPDDQFYHDTRGGYKYPTCKSCHNTRHRTEAMKEKARKTQKAIYERNKQNAKAAREWRGAQTIDSQKVLDLLARVRPDLNDTEICRHAEVHEDLVRTIRRNAAKDKPTSIGPVDRLLTGLDLTLEFNQLVEDGGFKIPKWHEKYDHCQNCYSVQRPHRMRGLCSTCYAHRKTPGWMPPPDNRWSMRYPSCIHCGKTDHVHAGFGECRPCRGRRRWREERKR